MIPDILQAFRSRYPGVELQLFEGSYVEVDSWIRSGIVDLGFLAGPSDGLDIIQLMSDPYVAVLPANHPLRNHAVISIEQFTNEPRVIGLAVPSLEAISPAIAAFIKETQSLLT